MADNNTIARPYAQAVFELASEASDLAAWSESLDVARALLADGQVVTYLSNPALSKDRRLEFLSGLFDKAHAAKLAGKDKQGTNFLKLLIEYGRIAVLPEIASRFDVLKASAENVVDVTVSTAIPISKKQREAISEALRKRLGHEINLETEIDQTLIGGAVIKAGDVVIDGSLRARLEGLAIALKK